MKRVLRTSEERTSTAKADFRYCGISFAKKMCIDKSNMEASYKRPRANLVFLKPPLKAPLKTPQEKKKSSISFRSEIQRTSVQEKDLLKKENESLKVELERMRKDMEILKTSATTPATESTVTQTSVTSQTKCTQTDASGAVHAGAMGAIAPHDNDLEPQTIQEIGLPIQKNEASKDTQLLPINSPIDYKRFNDKLIESIVEQEELITTMNNGINVPDLDLYMKTYIKKLFTMQFFLKKISFNGRDGKTNMKHSLIFHCFAVSMIRKFESETKKDEEKNLVPVYKTKIQDFISNFKYLCNRNPNNWN